VVFFWEILKKTRLKRKLTQVYHSNPNGRRLKMIKEDKIDLPYIKFNLPAD